MKNYVSPVIFDNEELAEGVYATGSGTGADCWTVTKCDCVQNEKGYQVYELGMYHEGGHDSTVSEFRGVISGDVVGNNVRLSPEDTSIYSLKIEGNEYVISRTLHATMEYSVDRVTFKIFVNSDRGGVTLEMPHPTYCNKHLSPNNNY